jgi:hypothetical protein
VPFLSSIVGQAESQINNQVTGTVNSVQNAVGLAISNVKNTAANTAANLVGKTVQGAVGAATASINDILQGNVSGAISALNPATAFSSIFGGGTSSSGTAQLSSPGYFATQSSSGGITPGDALLGAQARPDPLLPWLWYCQLPVIGSGAGTTGAAPGITNLSNSLTSSLSSLIGGLGSALGGSIPQSNSSQLPWYYVEEASCPFRQFTNVSIFRDGRERHYPSRYTVGNLRLAFYADIANTSMTYLQCWNNAILQPYDASNLNLGGGFGRSSAFKYPIYIYLLDPMKNQILILEYVEAWPLNIADYGLNSSDGTGRVVNHVEFSVGDVFVSVLNVDAAVTQSILNNPLSNAFNAAAAGVQNAVGSALSAIF